ncbi:MAG: hypothetical protein ABIP54_02130 [Candidatus Andersenbacteria bacterium]
MLKNCPACKGAKQIMGAGYIKMVDCATCKGKGQVNLEHSVHDCYIVSAIETPVVEPVVEALTIDESHVIPTTVTPVKSTTRKKAVEKK